MCSNGIENRQITTVKTDIANMETNLHTNEQVSDELKDTSSLELQLTKQHIFSSMYRSVSRRKRRSRQYKRSQKSPQRKQIPHQQKMTCTSKPSQEPSSAHVIGTTYHTWEDIWSAEYEDSLKALYHQEKIDTMEGKHEWEQQSLNWKL